MKNLLIGMVLATALINTASASDDYHPEQLQKWLESEQILPLETILQQHRERLGGRVIDVELEQERNRFVYEIKVITEAGRKREFYFDGSTGELLKDDYEDGDHY